MFWRIIRRLLLANRGRLFVIMLALSAGAAVTAALLNLQVDAKRRITSEFRAFGANVIITPLDSSASLASEKLLDAAIVDRLPPVSDGHEVTKGEFLYGIVQVTPEAQSKQPKKARSATAVLAGYTVAAGTNYVADGLRRFAPSSIVESSSSNSLNVPSCEIGQKLASELDIHLPARLSLKDGTKEASCAVSAIRGFGGPEDSQVFFELPATQAFLDCRGRVSVIQAVVPGTPDSVNRYIWELAKRIPEADVHGLRQFTDAEARIYNRISGVLTATVAVVLILTGLCVMAAMTNVAMERKNDVGLMKALGGASERVIRLFLTEAALLGLAGGLLGAAVGIALSIWLGKAVFGLPAEPRLIVYLVAVLLTLIIAIAGAFPLRYLAGVRPASVFRGEA